MSSKSAPLTPLSSVSLPQGGRRLLGDHPPPCLTLHPRGRGSCHPQRGKSCFFGGGPREKISDTTDILQLCVWATLLNVALLGAHPWPGTPLETGFVWGSGVRSTSPGSLLSSVSPLRSRQPAVFCSGCVHRPLVSLPCGLRSWSTLCSVALEPPGPQDQTHKCAFADDNAR